MFFFNLDDYNFVRASIINSDYYWFEYPSINKGWVGYLIKYEKIKVIITD
jgi:hypothetical protein